MSKIDIYSEEYNEKDLNPIFNGGVAGIAKNCSARVERKKDGDPANHPKYRIVYTDEKGGSINEGYFDNIDEATDKGKAYFVKAMRHLLTQSGTKLAGGADTYSQLLDMSMRELSKAMPKNKYNLAVQFGTKDYPKSFLETNGYYGVLNVDSERLPNTHKDALMTRPVADDDMTPKETKDTSFMDGNDDTVTTDDINW